MISLNLLERRSRKKASKQTDGNDSDVVEIPKYVYPLLHKTIKLNMI